MQWQSELLEYSWGRARQPGELVRLVAARPGEPTPCHRLARVVETLSWLPHPYTGDLYPPYHKAAALLEWLFTERIEGTIVLLESNCVFRFPVISEIKRGQPKAAAWPDLPRGDGPFGLGSGFEFLEKFCVDRTIDLPAVTLPVLIHSSDLRKIVARWLELMSIIRAETAGTANGSLSDADNIAYAIAAAEAGIQHTVADLGAGIEAQQNVAPILDYRHPIASTDGDIAWDPGTYRNWEPVQPERAQPGPGREVLTLLSEFLERREQGLELAFLRPCRHKGVREGKILGSMFLDIPGRADTVSLNSSGAAIWEVCDGTRSLAEINRELETRFEMPPGSLRADIEVVIKRLERIGALRLEPV
ncbi:MAG: Coenzyme PQQ synthesis protein D (PqqD) [Candidatus Nitrotoga sp. CP45]|nr:MAG: Coenzyme PQQ synthesis protein D (PqqD) [Candidatus Nitrotoga sp. CP45]